MLCIRSYIKYFQNKVIIIEAYTEILWMQQMSA